MRSSTFDKCSWGGRDTFVDVSGCAGLPSLRRLARANDQLNERRLAADGAELAVAPQRTATTPSMAPKFGAGRMSGFVLYASSRCRLR
ncbi:MAG: hypothetical protein HYV63_33830 [Candidatus Schekmanbacteria bacterium]|nr:hypothetical protein [Candidatus Schekmanbacteria bacterium]